MTEAEKICDNIFKAVSAFFDQPAIKAYYAELARKNKEKADREERELRAKREAEEAERRRSKAYDVWALNGGSDECTQFGIHDGCKPWCPVFERGQCPIQAENEATFPLNPFGE